MSVDESNHLSRRERLAARRRRYRWTGVLVASVIVGAAGTVAAFAYTEAEAPAPSSEELTGTTNAGDRAGASDTSAPDGNDEVAVRPLSHEDPLRLWIGGDSLAGALGPALGERVGATGVVDAHVDYKVSSGLEPGVRNWPEYAADLLSERDPEAIVFMIGTNDANIVNSQDADDDGIDDWEPDYRARVAAMMDLLVGDGEKRTVIWIGAPTMRDEDRDEAVVEINRIMQEEAATRAPYVVYLDAYDLFGDPEDGTYTDRLEIDGETVRVRVGDGVHLTPAGAEYLATPVFALLDGRFHFGAQADPTSPLPYSMEEGGEITGGGSRGGSGNGNNRNGTGSRSGSGSGTQRRTTTTPPATSAAGDDEGEAPVVDAPVEPTPTTAATPPTDPPSNTTPQTQPPAEPSV
jgi:hypothetical protein